MVKILIFYSILGFVLCGCGEPKSMNQTGQDIHELEKEVMKGNIKAYNDLEIVYMGYPPGHFLYWALIMANKNKYPEAYLDVFYTIVFAYVGSIDDFQKMDEQNQKFAIEYLKVAVEYKVKEAIDILQKIENDKNDYSQKPPNFDTNTIK